VVRRLHAPALAAAFAVSVPATTLAQQDANPFERYLELAHRYRDGDPEGSAQRLAGWSAEDLQRATGLFHVELERHEPRVVVTVPATVALHTEAALLLRRHERYDTAFVRPLDPEAPLGPLWYRAVGDQYRAHAFVGRAEDLLEEGLTLYPEDAELWLARGGVYELIATVGAQREDGRGAAAAHSAPRDRYRMAAGAYRRALELRPGLDRARLRLARVSQQVGRLDEAEQALAAVLAAAPDERTSFMAHLFLGELFETRRDLRRALAEYRAAVAIHPGSASAQLALSYALLRSGARAAAGAPVRAALDAAGQEDYWLGYLAAADEHEASARALRVFAMGGGALAR
jgi:tetratricopeptide (TPR) repeat protein